MRTRIESVELNGDGDMWQSPCYISMTMLERQPTLQLWNSWGSVRSSCLELSTSWSPLEAAGIMRYRLLVSFPSGRVSEGPPLDTPHLPDRDSGCGARAVALGLDAGSTRGSVAVHCLDVSRGQTGSETSLHHTRGLHNPIFCLLPLWAPHPTTTSINATAHLFTVAPIRRIASHASVHRLDDTTFR